MINKKNSLWQLMTVREFLVTYSLLNSWLYAMKSREENETVQNEFLATLNREYIPSNDRQAAGIRFENLVTRLTDDCLIEDITEPWYGAAKTIADIIRGGRLQYRCRQQLKVDNITWLLYGKLDVLKAGTIYDIKFSEHYKRGAYYASPQHPVYMKLVPNADLFMYLITDGKHIWTERYYRHEIMPVENILFDFGRWLRLTGYWEIYELNWGYERS